MLHGLLAQLLLRRPNATQMPLILAIITLRLISLPTWFQLPIVLSHWLPARPLLATTGQALPCKKAAQSPALELHLRPIGSPAIKESRNNRLRWAVALQAGPSILTILTSLPRLEHFASLDLLRHPVAATRFLIAVGALGHYCFRTRNSGEG